MAYHGVPYKGIKSGCKGCPNRHPACHDHCQAYQDALIEWRNYNEMARHNKRMARILDSFKVEQSIRNLRRK